MPESQHKTGVTCLVCKNQQIVGEVSQVTACDPMRIPIGPGSKNYRYPIVTFYCPDCQIEYRHPPGKPKAAQEILAAEEVSSDW